MALRSILGQCLRLEQCAARNILPPAASCQHLHGPEAAAYCQRGYSTPSSDADASTSAAEGDEAAAAPAEPEAPQKRGRRWTRAQKGSWVDNTDLMDELDDAAVGIPKDMPIYDVRTDFPWLFEPKSQYGDMLARVAREAPEMLRLLDTPEYPLPYPGARHILRWETQMVLVGGPDHLVHPLNRKVRCWVQLRELQAETGITDAALQHIALICGPRYDPRKGLLRLVSDKYAHREENRRDILDTLHALVAEGERAFPQTDPEVLRVREMREQAREQYQASMSMPVPPHISVKDFLEGKLGGSSAEDAVPLAQQRQADGDLSSSSRQLHSSAGNAEESGMGSHGGHEAAPGLQEQQGSIGHSSSGQAQPGKESPSELGSRD